MQRHLPVLLSFLICSFFYLADAQIDTTRNYDLDGIRVSAGVNPADLLVEAACRHRSENSASSSASFKYVAYQKMSVMLLNLPDSLERWRDRPAFLSESVSEVFFKRPNRRYEKLVASKTSGIENPLFNLVFSQLQFQNFYDGDFLKILETEYVSPLSKNAPKNYDFSLEDTLYSSGDSVFVITFKPRQNAVFKSLKGVIHISSDNFAVPFVELEPTDNEILLPIRIAHTYRKAANGAWFPERMAATFDFPDMKAKGLDSVRFLPTSVITVKDLQVDIPLKNSDFGIYDLEERIASENAGNQLLATYRNDTLTAKELRTYVQLDSLGRKMKLDKRLNMLPSLLNGCVPIGPIDLDLLSVVNYSYYEGWRFGLGLYTNNKLSKRLNFGGYFAYGLKDRDWKYGARAEFELWPARALALKLCFADDLTESGCTQLISRDEFGLLNGEFYRHWLITRFDKSRLLSGKLQMRPDRNFTVSIAAGYSHNRTLFAYSYLPLANLRNEDGTFSYRHFSLRFGVRFAYREATLRSSAFSLYEPSKFPTVQLQYEQGIKGVFGSDFTYSKLNLRVHHKQVYRRFGYTEVALDGGWIDRSVPYSLQYVSPAGYEKLGFYGKEQFAAMRPNEFLADAYVSLFLRHNFGKMRESRFSPRIVLCQNIGFGWLRNAADHGSVDFQTMEKGYFETGIMVDNLLSVKDLLSMGLGVFYRYGAYAMPNQLDNFAIKVSLTVPMLE